LALCGVLLERLGEDPKAFYDSHHSNVLVLLDETRTEVGQLVAAKLARARRRLSELEERLGDDVFQEATARLEGMASDELHPDYFGYELLAVNADCPECNSKGRLFGRVDVEPEVDYDVEPLGGGRYETHMIGYWSITLSPQAFACNVCQLRLLGPQELAEGGLPASRHEVQRQDLGEDFDPELYAESIYGLED
jgi:hypothetical protein